MKYGLPETHGATLAHLLNGIQHLPHFIYLMLLSKATCSRYFVCFLGNPWPLCCYCNALLQHANIFSLIRQYSSHTKFTQCLDDMLICYILYNIEGKRDAKTRLSSAGDWCKDLVMEELKGAFWMLRFTEAVVFCNGIVLLLRGVGNTSKVGGGGSSVTDRTWQRKREVWCQSFWALRGIAVTGMAGRMQEAIPFP